MNIQHQIRDYVVENFLFGSEDGLNTSQSLIETGVVDSTGVMELVLFLEETFGITVDDEDLVPDNLDSIDNMKRFVERKCA